MVLTCTGLVDGGDRLSSPLLFREPGALTADLAFPAVLLSVPDKELDDIFLPLGGLDNDAGLPGTAADMRPPLNVLLGPAVGLVTDDAETCRPPRAAGTGGGAMDGRPALTEGRGLPSALAFDGVPVLEGAALEEGVASCLVGDFGGDWALRFYVSCLLYNRDRGKHRRAVATYSHKA